ncbi:MAG TPA: branched-chain amino acid ABC transporter permease, partial [Bifidobacterium sp.]|nr:branched-chain amino acid ABC transporter permease [Bifidobacterium sp.]
IIACGLPAWLSVVPAILVCVAVGVIVEKAAYKPVREKGNNMTALITAIAMSLLLENGSQALFGADYQTIPTIIQIPSLAIGDLKIDGATIVTVLLGIVIMIALQLFVSRTKQGKAMRAVSEDKEASILMGVNVNSTITLTFAIGSGLAAVASLMYCISYPQVSPMMGAMLGLKAFVAAVLGGIGSIPGAMVGGLAIGVVESLTKAYIGTITGGVITSAFADAIVFGILIIVLLVKPSGLMGEPESEKV